MVNVNDKAINCCGCGACYNVCPKNAIQMAPNDEGFFRPCVDETKCVDCGLCVNICPELNAKFENSETPQCLAVMADLQTRKESASGGAFGVFAKTVLEENGTVFGAAWNDDFSLSHRSVLTQEELTALHGSKYVQSNTKDTYKEAKELLDNGTKVLYSGTPCQIAGLYAFLQNRPDNLLTVEVLCHGTPSQKVFRKYINENFDMPDIKQISFTSKGHFGWGKGLAVIDGKGKTYAKKGGEDLFFGGFDRNIYLNSSCYSCKFSRVPRQADISVGDFWQIEKFDKKLNDGKGTSIVLLNNKKGQDFFDKCKEKFAAIKEVPLDFIKNTVNRNIILNGGAVKNPVRERFFSHLDDKNINDNIEECVKGLYDIGLVGIYSVENFGGAVTYYSLYKVLKSMGYSVLMIDRPFKLTTSKKNLDIIYKNIPYSEYEIAPNYTNTEQMRVLNGKCGKFAVGSDQLFNSLIFNLFGKFASLNWVNENKKKIAIGVSFGHSDFYGTENERARLQYDLDKFDAISVREESGVDLMKRKFGIEAQWILDPVFLCDKEDIFGLVTDERSQERYIGGYILDPNKEKADIIKDICDEYNLPCSIYREEFVEPENDSWEIPRLSGKIEDRLKNIRDCEIFVTDSYHGLCLALIMNKPVVAIVNKDRGRARFETIQKVIGVSVVNNYEEYIQQKEQLFAPNYKKINKKISEKREESLAWIEAALAIDYQKPLSDKNVIEENIRFYGSILQLNLTPGCTVQQIIDYLPENSYFQQVQGAMGEPLNGTPLPYGVLSIKKATKDFIDVQFVQNSLTTSTPKLFLGNVVHGKLLKWSCCADAGNLENVRKKLDDIRMYTDIFQLGLKAGCSIQDIVDKLPDNSCLQQVQGAINEPISDTPMPYGVLTVKKATNYFIDIQFSQMTYKDSRPKIWIAHVLDHKVADWERIIGENEFNSKIQSISQQCEKYKQQIEELEKDVRFLIRNYAKTLND